MPIFELECQECNTTEEIMCSYEQLLSVLHIQGCSTCKGKLKKLVSKPAPATWAGDKSFSVSGGKATKE